MTSRCTAAARCSTFGALPYFHSPGRKMGIPISLPTAKASRTDGSDGEVKGVAESRNIHPRAGGRLYEAHEVEIGMLRRDVAGGADRNDAPLKAERAQDAAQFVVADLRKLLGMGADKRAEPRLRAVRGAVFRGGHARAGRGALLRGGHPPASRQPRHQLTPGDRHKSPLPATVSF